MNNINYKILTLIQFILPAYLIISLLPIPFWYYASVRWIILVICIYLTILSFSNELVIHGMLMLGVMFLFRPIYPFILEGMIYSAFILSAIILFLMTANQLKEKHKKKSEIELPDLSQQINSGEFNDRYIQ